jgi:hypothetical protein
VKKTNLHQVWLLAVVMVTRDLPQVKTNASPAVDDTTVIANVQTNNGIEKEPLGPLMSKKK